MGTSWSLSGAPGTRWGKGEISWEIRLASLDSAPAGLLTLPMGLQGGSTPSLCWGGSASLLL